MSLVRATAILFVLAMGVAEIVPSASAQPAPGSRPTVHVPITLPITTPPGWDAKQWATVRQQCQTIRDKSASGIALTRGEFQQAEVCTALSPPDSSVTREPELPQRQFQASPVSRPTPAPSPLSSVGPASSVGPQIGPFGTPITGYGGDACSTQPPDLAADVSSNQIVELLNFGIWISDKQGTVAAGYPVPLSTFWAPNSPPSGNFLIDTQIAFDPIAQKWLATTISVTNTKDNGDLYFAFSQTSDAIKNPWNFYKLPKICSNTQGGQFPAPDNPVLGYNQTWVAIELQCSVAGGGFAGQDQLILIPTALRFPKSAAPHFLSIDAAI